MRATVVGLRVKALVLAALSTASISVPYLSHAVWYGEGVPENSDIVMMDLRWPYWPGNTYFANWNSSILPGGKISFYAGYATYCRPNGDLPCTDKAYSVTYHPEWVWSFWAGNSTGLPPAFSDTCEDMLASNSGGGEGCASSLSNLRTRSPQENTWNTFVTRVWTDPDTGKGFMGRWMRDLSTGEWTAIAIAKFDQPATGLAGNSGFIETVGNPNMPRTLERRKGYARSATTGEWKATDTITATTESSIVMKKFTDEREEYVAIQYAGGEKNLPWGEKMKDGVLTTGKDSKDRSISAAQPKAPEYLQEKWQLKSVEAFADDEGVTICWTNDFKKTPVFAFIYGEQKRVVANCDATGVVRFPRGRKGDKLVAENLFGVKSPVKWHKTSDEVFPPADTEKRLLASGLKVTFDKKKSGTVPTIDAIRLLELGDNGVAQGYIEIPKNGVYIFRVRADGGFKLTIDGRQFIDRMYMHGSTVYSRAAEFAEGMHFLEFEFCREGDTKGGMIREIVMEGPGMAPRKLGKGDFYTAKPSAAVKSPLKVKTLVNGLNYDEKISVPPTQGAEYERIEFYKDDTFAVTEVKMLKGEEISVPKGWTYHNLGSDAVNFGVKAVGKNGLKFSGQGMHLIAKRVTGDFTATIKLGERSLNGENFEYLTWTGVGAFPVNRGRSWHWPASWYVFRRPWFDEVRTAADFSDLGSTRMSHAQLKKGDWLRISRKGDICYAWTSEDGKNWILGAAQHHPNLSKEVDVGVYVMANAGKRTKDYYATSVSEMSVENFAVELPPLKQFKGKLKLKAESFERKFDEHITYGIENKDGVSILYKLTDGKRRDIEKRTDCVFYDFVAMPEDRFVVASSIGLQYNESHRFCSAPQPMVADWWGPVKAIAQSGRHIVASSLTPENLGVLMTTDNGGLQWGMRKVPAKAPIVSIKAEKDEWVCKCADGSIVKTPIERKH